MRRLLSRAAAKKKRKCSWVEFAPCWTNVYIHADKCRWGVAGLFIFVQGYWRRMCDEWVSYSQIATARNQFRMDLFEKRHEVFVATWKFLSDLIHKNPVSTADIFNFCNSTANAKFLFGDDIVAFLDDAKIKGIQLGTAEY